MLLKFSVSNFKGIKEKQSFDLMATNGNEYSENLYEINENLKINTSACLIGPNGAGKSHLLEAMNTFSKAIISSEYIKYAHNPFILDGIHQSLPTEYEALLYNEADKQFLIYSFSVLFGKVISESLEIKKNTPKVRSQNIFTRNNDLITFSTKYKSIEKLLKNTLSDGGLILNFASSIKNEPINFIYIWATRVLFADKNIFEINANHLLNNHIKNLINIEPNILDEHKNRLKKETFPSITKILQSFDLPINKVEFKEAEDQSYYIMITPKTNNLQQKSLNIQESKDFFSEGTFNSLTLVISISLVPFQNLLLLIDEYDASLHHKLSLALLNFIREVVKSNKSQVVISTHDISLLDNGFRRDSISILSKDDTFSTQISRASDFSIRKDAKISLKYLNNEFGALPKIFEGEEDE